MTFLFTRPDVVIAAATDLAGIGTTINNASVAAAAPTVGVVAAGADEVSAAIAAIFGSHAQQYQSMSAQASILHSQFVKTLTAAGNAYAGAEAANVQQQLLNLI